MVNSKYSDHLEQFRSNIIEHLDRKTDELGVILKCHLITEHYIDQYLKKAYPEINWEKVGLSFNKKLQLINNPKTLVGIGMYVPSMENINSLRNKFAHIISYKIEPKDYFEIEKIMRIWYSEILNKPISKDLALIKDFTVWVCANLDLMTNSVENNTESLDLLGYLKEVSKILNVELEYQP